MSNRRITMLVIAAIIFGALFIVSNKKAQEQEAVIAQVLGYEQEIFLKEGGYTAARNYGDSIFTELYCNTLDIVYQYAFTDNNIDIPHRELIAAIMTTSPTENHLYLEYQIPQVETVKNEDGTPTDDWQYNGRYDYAILDMRNIERHGVADYSCSDFSIISGDVHKVMEGALDINAGLIPEDDQQRGPLDYGVLFNKDTELASSMASRDKERISACLLARQKENAGDYAFSSASENESVSANLTDYSETTRTTTAPTPTVSSDEGEVQENVPVYSPNDAGAASPDAVEEQQQPTQKPAETQQETSTPTQDKTE